MSEAAARAASSRNSPEGLVNPAGGHNKQQGGHMINWSNLTIERCAAVLLKIAYRYGWDRAEAIAQKELGEDAEEALRLAHIWEQRRRY